jgi:hypothetical protein
VRLLFMAPAGNSAGRGMNAGSDRLGEQDRRPRRSSNICRLFGSATQRINRIDSNEW